MLKNFMQTLTPSSILKLSLVCGIFFLWSSQAQAKEKISYQQVKYSVGDIVLKGHLMFSHIDLYWQDVKTFLIDNF